MSDQSDCLKKGFALHEEVMKKMGLLPFNNNLRLYKIYAWGLYFLLIIPLPSMQFIYYMHANKEERSRVYSNLHILLEIMVLIIKIYPIKKNPQAFINNMNVWKNGIDKSYSNLDADILKEGERMHTFVLKFILGTSSVTVCAFMIQHLLASKRQLPYNFVLPFDALSDTAIYYVVSIYLHFTCFHAAVTNIVMDTLMASLLYHSAKQIKIVKKRLQYMESYIKDDLDKVTDQLTEDELKVYTDKLVHEKIGRCTDLIEKVIKYVEDTEDLYSVPVFAQFLCHALVIASLILHIWTTPLKSSETLITVMFFVAALSQIFVYCHAGALLLEESQTLPDAIFFGNWPEYSKENKKALIIMMERAKKPITVTAGKIVPLDLESFALIMKRSYTILAVLNNFSRT